MDNNLQNQKNSNNKKIIIISIIAIIVVAIIVIVIVLSLKQDKEEQKPTKQPEQEELTVEEIGNKINDIMIIGVEIYNSGKYLEFPKSEISGYYATKGKLKELGYTNIDEIVINCHDNDRVLYFDVDHIENYSDGIPILTIPDCSK